MKHAIKSCLAIGFLAATMAHEGLGAQPPAVRAFIADALARGENEVRVAPVRVGIDPGDDNAYFTFRGLRETTIDFQGCDFFGSRRTRALWLSDCTNVTIRNLTFDYDPLPFTQARITAVGLDGEWDMEVVDGYPAPETSEYYWPLQVYGGKSHELVNEFREGPGFRLEKTGARTYRATGGSNKAGSVGDIAVWSLKDTGNSATLPCTVLLENCSGCRIENVSLYSTAPGFGIFELFGDGNAYVNCTIDRRPPETDIAPRGVPRLRSGNHDAFHSKMAAHGPILDGCRFAYHCDDSVNISSFYYVVTEVDGDEVRAVGHDSMNFIVPLRYGLDIAPGDELEVLAADGRAMQCGIVASVADDGAVSDEEIDYLKTLGMWPGVPERCRERSLRIKLSWRGLPSRDDTAGGPPAPPVACGDAIMSSRLQGRGFAIRNCRFGPHRALGMRIRASDGVIGNNVVEGTIGEGLWMGPEFEFLEGGFCRNVLVRDNVFDRCGKGGIHVGGHTSGRREIAHDAHEGVVLSGNRVIDGASPLRGVQLPMRNMRPDDFNTLEEWGVRLVRYQMTRAFLQHGYGPDGYEGYRAWLEGKVDHLVSFVIPECRRRGMKVVVDLHEPPGYREPRSMEWTIYFDQTEFDRFIDCWRMIAERVKGNADVVYGYDILNEPEQKREATTFDYLATQEVAARAIREIDPKTAIIVEARDWDRPGAFAELRPLPLDNVIYEVHMYRPPEFTHQGAGGEATRKTLGAKWPDPEKGWDTDFLRRELAPVREFERKFGAKIYVGEFSAIAWGEGADRYLRDVISIFGEYGWDWTYHAFREWQAWSVEHEVAGPGQKPTPSADNPRKRALLEGLRK